MNNYLNLIDQIQLENSIHESIIMSTYLSMSNDLCINESFASSIKRGIIALIDRLLIALKDIRKMIIKNSQKLKNIQVNKNIHRFGYSEKFKMDSIDLGKYGLPDSYYMSYKDSNDVLWILTELFQYSYDDIIGSALSKIINNSITSEELNMQVYGNEKGFLNNTSDFIKIIQDYLKKKTDCTIRDNKELGDYIYNIYTVNSNEISIEIDGHELLERIHNSKTHRSSTKIGQFVGEDLLSELKTFKTSIDEKLCNVIDTTINKLFKTKKNILRIEDNIDSNIFKTIMSLISQYDRFIRLINITKIQNDYREIYDSALYYIISINNIYEKEIKDV